MKKDNNEIEKEEIKEEKFLDRYKNDSRYKAKVQLTGWGILIVSLILWINISAIISDDSYEYLNQINNTIKEKEENILVSKLKDNNYAYKIEIDKNKENNIEKITYDGKVINTSRKVTKTYNNIIEEYYIENGNYYLKNNEAYSLINSSTYYSFISESFMDLTTIINYINVGTLDSTTNFNDGRVVKNYIIKLKDIVLNNSEDTITISVTEDNLNSTLEFNVDYTNLYNFYDVNKIDSLKIKYFISDFNKIEKFNDIVIK